jgi:hypothetical protein
MRIEYMDQFRLLRCNLFAFARIRASWYKLAGASDTYGRDLNQGELKFDESGLNCIRRRLDY